MKSSLFTRIFLLYVVIGIVSVLFFSSLGSIMVEKRLIRRMGEQLYQETLKIAGEPAFILEAPEEQQADIQNVLNHAAGYQQCEIWIIDEHGELLSSSDGNVQDYDKEELLSLIDVFKEGLHYKQETLLEDHSEPTLTSLTPILDDGRLTAYILIQYPMSLIYRSRDSFQAIMLLSCIALYIVSLIPLLIYHSHIHRPIMKIIRGANEYGSGNLNYVISYEKDNEIGYLAKSLNYMAQQLDKNSQYQRRVVSDISHDFRSPLTSIKGYASAMLDGTIPQDMYERYLSIIANEAGRLEKLTQSLTDLHELDTHKRLLHRTFFCINEAIISVADAFEGICHERKVMLRLNLFGRQLLVNADKEQIQQIMYNLIDNAIKFSAPGSEVIISTSVKSGKVFVSVKDHGQGIPKEALPRIWERFYKQDSSRGKDRKGIGLGLSIVKEIIKAHGETIDVISTEGVGTEFIFSLSQK